MMNAALFVIVSTGMLISIQIMSNTLLGKSLGLAYFTVIFTVVQLVSAVVVWQAARFLERSGYLDPSTPAAFAEIPWFHWVGGLFGSLILIGISYSTPKLGALPSIVGLVCGQLLMSLVIDHFGLFGMAQRGTSPAKVIGVGFVLLGLFLTRA